jgi:hypothetical protein
VPVGRLPEALHTGVHARIICHFTAGNSATWQRGCWYAGWPHQRVLPVTPAAKLLLLQCSADDLAVTVLGDLQAASNSPGES